MVEIVLLNSRGFVVDQIASVMLDTGDDTLKDRKRYKEQESNAVLIAAAPDLYAACLAAKKYLEPDLVEPGRTVFWNLVEAIKKAEGK